MSSERKRVDRNHSKDSENRKLRGNVVVAHQQWLHTHANLYEASTQMESRAVTGGDQALSHRLCDRADRERHCRGCITELCPVCAE